MTDLSDAKHDRLLLSGYGPASTNDMEVEWLKSLTTWEFPDPAALNDLYYLWLSKELNREGSINDLWYEYLTLSGYDVTGALPDMLFEFWTDTKVLPAPVTLAEALAALSTAVTALVAAVSSGEAGDLIATLQRAVQRAIAAVRRAG